MSTGCMEWMTIWVEGGEGGLICQAADGRLKDTNTKVSPAMDYVVGYGDTK